MRNCTHPAGKPTSFHANPAPSGPSNVPPSGPDGAKILMKLSLGAQFLAHPVKAGPWTMVHSLGCLPRRPCAPWRKSLPAKTLSISLLTPLNRPVDRRLIVGQLQVCFYLTALIFPLFIHQAFLTLNVSSLFTGRDEDLPFVEGEHNNQRGRGGFGKW